MSTTDPTTNPSTNAATDPAGDPATTWSTTATLDQIATRLAHARRVLVLTHLKPDGDAVGSTLAITRAINLREVAGGGAGAGREAPARVWYAGPLPPWLDVVAEKTPRDAVPPEGPAPHEDFDAILIADTGSWSQLEPVAEWLRKRTDDTIIIDHHVQGDPEVAAMRHIDTSAAAACQPAAELCRILLGKKTIEELPAEVATPLYLGLATDTGWFRHSNVDKRVMETAGRLIKSGAEHTRLYAIIEQQETLARLHLLARALESTQLFAHDQIAVMSIRKRDLSECGAQPGDSGGFIDHPQSIPSVRVSVLLTEAGTSEESLEGSSAPDAPAMVNAASRGVLTKISLRSKPPLGDGKVAVDVNAVAREFGGGGHVRAAGARVGLTLEETRDKLIEVIGRQLAGGSTDTKA